MRNSLYRTKVNVPLSNYFFIKVYRFANKRKVQCEHQKTHITINKNQVYIIYWKVVSRYWQTCGYPESHDQSGRQGYYVYHILNSLSW